MIINIAALGRQYEIGDVHMNWLRRFMTGRYGGDRLSMVLLVLALILSFAASLTGLQILSVIGYAVIALCLFRMLSKNIVKRRLESDKFNKIMFPVISWFRMAKNRAINVKTFRYFTCPSCKTKLRVPRGKGSITITCPKCKTRFEKKT